MAGTVAVRDTSDEQLEDDNQETVKRWEDGTYDYASLLTDPKHHQRTLKVIIAYACVRPYDAPPSVYLVENVARQLVDQSNGHAKPAEVYAWWWNRGLIDPAERVRGEEAKSMMELVGETDYTILSRDEETLMTGSARRYSLKEQKTKKSCDDDSSTRGGAFQNPSTSQEKEVSKYESPTKYTPAYEDKLASAQKGKKTPQKIQDKGLAKERSAVKNNAPFSKKVFAEPLIDSSDSNGSPPNKKSTFNNNPTPSSQSQKNKNTPIQNESPTKGISAVKNNALSSRKRPNMPFTDSSASDDSPTRNISTVKKNPTLSSKKQKKNESLATQDDKPATMSSAKSYLASTQKHERKRPEVHGTLSHVAVSLSKSRPTSTAPNLSSQTPTKPIPQSSDLIPASKVLSKKSTTASTSKTPTSKLGKHPRSPNSQEAEDTPTKSKVRRAPTATEGYQGTSRLAPARPQSASGTRRISTFSFINTDYKTPEASKDINPITSSTSTKTRPLIGQSSEDTPPKSKPRLAPTATEGYKGTAMLEASRRQSASGARRPSNLSSSNNDVEAAKKRNPVPSGSAPLSTSRLSSALAVEKIPKKKKLLEAPLVADSKSIPPRHTGRSRAEVVSAPTSARGFDRNAGSFRPPVVAFQSRSASLTAQQRSDTVRAPAAPIAPMAPLPRNASRGGPDLSLPPRPPQSNTEPRNASVTKSSQRQPHPVQTFSTQSTAPSSLEPQSPIHNRPLSFTPFGEDASQHVSFQKKGGQQERGRRSSDV